jgi:ATP-binding cassette, subfamily B, bacterial PglK
LHFALRTKFERPEVWSSCRQRRQAPVCRGAKGQGVVINIGDLRRATALLDPDLRWRWAGLCVLSVIAALLEAVGALGVFWLIGIVHSPETATSLPVVGPLAAKLGYDGSPAWLIGCAIAVVAFYVVKNAFLVVHYYLQVRLPHDAYVRVSTELLRGYLTTDYSFHFDRNSAESVRNLINSVDVVFRTVLLNAVTLINELLVVIAVICVLLVASPENAILAAGATCVLAWMLLRLTQSRVTRWGLQVQSLAKDILKVINQGLGAIKEVKVSHREDYFINQYYRLRRRQSRVMSFYETFQSLPLFALEALFTSLVGVLIIVITLQGGNHATTVPLLGLYGYAGFRLLPALARIAAKLQRLGFGSAAVNQVYNDYMQLRKQPAASLPDVAPLPFTREIRFDEVTYSYPRGNRTALNGISLTIPYGHSIGIVGPSGGGKSTLVDILLGLLSPDSGRVLVDGVDSATSIRAWRRNLGYVPQSPYLLDETLRRNIAFGVPDADIDEQALAEALRMAQLNDLVDSLPKGLDTEIGERGVRLSGGQRQRIVIARALYRQPTVLVFDEATSELDNLTESEIAAEIDALSGDKTIVVIAHRMTTVRNCDVIVFLVEGRIADLGSYDELLARNTEFSKLALTDNSRPNPTSGTESCRPPNG